MATDLFSAALRMAAYHHGSQRDRSGKPYILHPMHVAEMLLDEGADDETLAVALMHDLLEDTSYSAQQMLEDFGPTITDAVLALTRIGHSPEERETYMEYIARLSQNPIAKRVKVADLKHNLSRMDNLPTEEERRFLRSRYSRALSFLGAK